MTDSRLCPRCGSPTSPGLPPSHCPRCAGLRTDSATATHIPTGSKPPTRPAPSDSRTGRPEDIRATMLQLGLVAAEDLARLEGGRPDPLENGALLQLLVDVGKVTAYQAGALAQGKARGLLVGDYLILDRLGAGGMGKVFQVRHRRLGAVLALKLLPPSFGRDPDAVARFRREVQIASHLEHPNLVPAFDTGTDRGVPFLVMEQVSGRDLERVVLEGGPLPTKLALDCTIQAARGLEAAHARGVVHRDVKPANLMLDPAGVVRVLDLGLARVIEATSPLARGAGATLTQTGAYMGTVDYIAPEQADDAKRADARADIYSLGCTLHFLLTARPPFDGDTVLKKLLAHQARPAPSLRATRPEIPAALDDPYLAMMSKRPDDRPTTMAEVIRRLEACSSQLSRPDDDAGVSLREFARTALKRAGVKPRLGLDATVFARPRPPADGLSLGPEVSLEDLISDYRAETPIEDLPEEKLPPRAPSLRPSRGRSRGSRAPAVLVLAVTALAGAAILWPRPPSDSPPAQPLPAQEETAEAPAPPTPTAQPEPAVPKLPETPDPPADYPAQLEAARTAAVAGDWGGAIAQLGRCAPERRGWEWGYLHRLCERRTSPDDDAAAPALRGGARYFGTLSFSGDSQRIAAASVDRLVKVWSPGSGEGRAIPVPGEGLTICGVAFRPDGRMIAAATTHGLRLLDVGSGASASAVRDHSGSVNAVAFSPDGRRLASAGDDGTVRLRDLGRDRPPRILSHPTTVNDVAFRRDGQRLASCSTDGIVRIWDAASGELVASLSGHSAGVAASSFHPDGTRLATSSADRSIIIWDLASGRPIRRLEGHAGTVDGLAFSPDGRRLAAALQDRKIQVWDADTGDELFALGGPVLWKNVAFSPDGLRLAACGSDRGILSVWEAAPYAGD